MCEVIIRRIPFGVLAMDDSALSLQRRTNREMIACSPKAVSQRESTVEVTNGRDEVDWEGVVLGDLRNDFSHVLKLVREECPWLCSEGAREVGLKTLNLLEDLDCFMPIRARDNKR